MMALSFSSAIIGGDELLATSEPAFISMSLLSLFTGMIIHVHQSTVPFITAGPYTSLSPLLASVAHGFSVQCAPDAWLPTTMVCFSLLSIASGVLLRVLAHPRVRLGKAAAYLPAPVLMGMMVAIAVTLVISALQLATGVVVFQTSPLGPLLLRPVPSDPALLRRAGLQAACALAVGGSLFCCRFAKRSASVLLTPLVLLVAILLFQLVAFCLGTPTAELRESRWLSRELVLESPLDAFASTSELVGGLLGGRVDWSALFDLRTSPLQALPVYCCVDILLVAGTLPALIMMPTPQDRAHVDADSELATAGASAIIQGLLGIPASGYFVGTSMQHRDLRGSRRSGWIIVGMCGCCLLLGPLLASSVPRFVLGGLFVNFAVGYVSSASTIAMTSSEIAVLVVTAVTYVGLGAMAGLMVGLVFTCLHFVIEQSYIEAGALVEAANFGSPGTASRRGSLQSGAGSSLAPNPAGAGPEHVSIALHLKGVLFFATTHALTAEILRNVQEHGSSTSGSVLLNFGRVQSVDVSTIHTLKQLAEELAVRNWQLKCTGLRSRLAARFAKVGLAVIVAVPPSSAGGAGGKPAASAAVPAPLGQTTGLLASQPLSPVRQSPLRPSLDGSSLFDHVRANDTAGPPVESPGRASRRMEEGTAVETAVASHASSPKPRQPKSVWLQRPAELDASVGKRFGGASQHASLGAGGALCGGGGLLRYAQMGNDSADSLVSTASAGAGAPGALSSCVMHVEPSIPRVSSKGLYAIPNDSVESLHAYLASSSRAQSYSSACPRHAAISEQGTPPPPMLKAESSLGALPTFGFAPVGCSPVRLRRSSGESVGGNYDGALLIATHGEEEEVALRASAHDDGKAEGTPAAAGAQRLPAAPPSLIPEDLSQLTSLFKSYGTSERVAAQATILRSNDSEIATEVAFLVEGDAIQWRSRKALGGEALAHKSLATLKTSGSLIGGAEVVLANPRHFEARMLSDGEVVRLSIQEMMRIRVEQPEAWELILLKSLQGQTNIVNEALFAVEA